MESIFRLTEPARFEPAFQIYRKETAIEKRIIDTIPMCYSVGAMRSEGGLKLIYAGEGNGRVAVYDGPDYSHRTIVWDETEKLGGTMSICPVEDNLQISV